MLIIVFDKAKKYYYKINFEQKTEFPAHKQSVDLCDTYTLNVNTFSYVLVLVTMELRIHYFS